MFNWSNLGVTGNDGGFDWNRLADSALQVGGEAYRVSETQRTARKLRSAEVALGLGHSEAGATSPATLSAGTIAIAAAVIGITILMVTR